MLHTTSLAQQRAVQVGLFIVCAMWGCMPREQPLSASGTIPEELVLTTNTQAQSQ